MANTRAGERAVLDAHQTIDDRTYDAELFATVKLDSAGPKSEGLPTHRRLFLEFYGFSKS